MAVAGGHEDIYDILIKAGANVNKYSVKVLKHHFYFE